MPNGAARFGERFKDWLWGLFEAIGLDKIIENERARRAEWDAIASLEDLQAYAKKYPGAPPHVMVQKAQQLGAPEQVLMRVAYPEATDRLDDPSTFISKQLQAAFESPAWQELNEVFGAVVFDPWLASITAGKLDPQAPELEVVRRFLGTQATFEALGSVISTIVETASAGQIENAGRMFTDAKWILGTCFTSWQSTSPVVEAVILKPLERLINLTFRQADFTRAQWMDLFALGLIDHARLGMELGRLGYDSEKIGWLLSLAKRQPSRSDALRMWRKGIIGPVTFADQLRKEGYDTEWVTRYIELYQQEEAGEEKGAYLGTLRKAFKEQLISEAELRDALKQQDRSAEAIDLEVAVLKLGWEVEAKTATKGDVRAAYGEDIIGRPEAVKALADAGFASHTIDLLLATWDKQKAPSYRQLNKSEALKAWGLGVLSRSECYQLLVNIGYDEHGATVLMETYAKAHLATKPPATRQLRTSDIMAAWHAEVIDDSEAKERLVDLGLSEDDAQLLFETFRRLHPRVIAKPPKELQKDDILDAYGRGVLIEEIAFEKLVGIGYIETDADILMTTYEQRPEALPPEPTIAELIGATRRGVITPAVLSQKLAAMGLKAEDAQFYVTYATTPLPERTRSLSRTDIVNLWKQGRHNRAWALERLLSMNYSPEDATDILWLASPEVEDTETYILWTAGLLDVDIAIAMWQSMGFSQEAIGAVLEG